MKEMVGGCCVCSDERGWAENPLVYCDGHGCSVAVHQACYGIVHVPTGPWFCRKCESQERAARVRCELCPHKDGALKRTDNGGWAHVVCALYIPEVQFANVSTMEPIVLQYVPHDRYNKTCYLCEEQGRESKAATGACMTCNKHGCRQAFHVTCAQMAGLLCEEEGVGADNVKYCGYCKYHYSKMKGRPAGRSAFDAGLGEAASHSQEKHERDKKGGTLGQSGSQPGSLPVPCLQKNREKEKQKRHKRVGEPSPLLPSLTVTTEKTYTSPSGAFLNASLKRLDDPTSRFTHANFKEVPVHSGTGSEGSEGKCQDGKKKKLPHGSGQKGKKGGSGAVKSVSLVQSAQELLGYVDLNTHKDGYAPASGLKGSGQGSGATRDGPKAMDGACQDPTAAPSKAALGGSAAPPPPPPPPPSLCAPAPTASPPRLYEKAYEHSSPPKLYEKAYEEYVMSGFSTVAGKRSHPCSSGKDESGPGWENKRKASKKAKPSVGLARAAAASVGGPGGAPPPAAAASSIAGAATCPGGGAVGGGAAGPPALDGLATGGGVGGGGGGGGGRAGGAGRPDALPTSSRLSSSSNSSSASSVASSTSSACGSSAKSPSSQRNGSFHSMRAASASPPGSCSHSPPPPGLPASGGFLSGDAPPSLQSSGGPSPLFPSALAQPHLPTLPPLQFSSPAFPPTLSTQSGGCLRSPHGLAPAHLYGSPLSTATSVAALPAITPAAETSSLDDKAVDNSDSRLHKKSIASHNSAPSFLQTSDMQVRFDAAPSAPSGRYDVPQPGLSVRYEPGHLGPGMGRFDLGQAGMGMGPGPAGLEAAQQPTPTSIEQLLERQLNEGQHFLIEQAAPPDVIGYLRGLHRLQTENRRLEEQIRMLTARRERLMLLSSQLALPLGHADQQCSRKTPPGGAGFHMDGSLTMSAAESGSGTPLSVPSSSPLLPGASLTPAGVASVLHQQQQQHSLPVASGMLGMQQQQQKGAAMPTLTPAQGAACMPTGMLVHPQGPGSSNSIPSLVVQQSPQQQQQQQQQGLGMQQSLSLQQHNTVGMPSMSVQQQQHQGAGLTGVQQQVAAGVGAMQGGAGRMLSGLPGSQISINGLVGALNSVVQTPAAAPMGQNSSPNHPTLGLSMPSSLGNSISGLALLQDQQRQILMHQQQSFHQLLGDQLFTQDPQQLMYHLMQQQQQQHQQQQQQHQQHQQQGPSNAASHEQHLAGGPSCTLPPLGGTPVPVSAPGQANPFLSLHSDQAALKKRSERGTPGSGDGS
ncbi:protein AF-17 isoform X1 [Lampetra fluviatilis]